MHIEKQGTRFVCVCSFAEKDIPKAAGFRWSSDQRCWWTPDAAKAAKLMDPDGAAKVLAEHAKKQELRKELIEDSRQADAAVDLPCPKGLAYLPYQRAGIASALRRFGFDFSLKGGVQSISSVRGVLFGDEMG